VKPLPAQRRVIDAPNLTEVIGKLKAGVAPKNEVERDVLALGLETVAFDEGLAFQAAFYYVRRNPHHLSLGDCACLATAETLGLGVLTAERDWVKIPDVGVKIRLIRWTHPQGMRLTRA
jgi:PIN domain nuclease of toxin-antitoxin system